MGLISEFKTFVSKGNVVDLAVGVIIGGAFGKIVESMVKDVITPLIGKCGGMPDFSGLAIGATKVMKDGKEVLEGGIMIGNFLNAAIAFLILAAIVFFMIVKPMNAMMAKMNPPPAPGTPPPPPADIVLLTEIRDLLKK